MNGMDLSAGGAEIGKLNTGYEPEFLRLVESYELQGAWEGLKRGIKDRVAGYWKAQLQSLPEPDQLTALKSFINGVSAISQGKQTKRALARARSMPPIQTGWQAGS